MVTKTTAINDKRDIPLLFLPAHGSRRPKLAFRNRRVDTRFEPEFFSLNNLATEKPARASKTGPQCPAELKSTVGKAYHEWRGRMGNFSCRLFHSLASATSAAPSAVVPMSSACLLAKTSDVSTRRSAPPSRMCLPSTGCKQGHRSRALHEAVECAYL